MLRRLFPAVPGLSKVRFHNIFGRAFQSPPAPTMLAANTRVNEERVPGYDANDFYPARLGDVFNRRHEVVSKLGYGTRSTVWLARDTTR